jgi:uncharacterized membrane protein
MKQQVQPGDRLAYIDWMRGLACVLMFQAHCYNSWLTPDARKSLVYTYSQVIATVPAPLFIFLSGFSLAMVTERLRRKGLARTAIARTTILRGAQVFGLGLLFRAQEFALGYPKSPWTDLFRVDVLNILGLSIIFTGLLCWLTASVRRSPGDIVTSRTHAIIAALVTTVLVALATPLLWTIARPAWLLWPLESYINGVHVFNKPQAWLFPLFPWSAFAFAGLAIGFLLFSDVTKRQPTLLLAILGGAGALACACALLFDAAPLGLYPANIYDYWHTSPNFFLIRCGILLLLLVLAYAWCRWGLAQRGFSPFVQLGNTSLLVYWVHIEFVYGRLSILPKGQCSIAKATSGLLLIFAAMLLLSVLSTRWKRRPARVLQAGPASAAVPAEF